jgi:putative ABC transport system permease protein
MMMQLRPILATLRHHKAGTVLIALQIALTLAIVCNALFIIHQRLAHLHEPSGLDESNVLVVQNQWVGKPSTAEVSSRTAADLDTLRHMPGVADVYADISYPLGSNGVTYGIGHDPDKRKFVATTAIYFLDQNALPTLGLKLVAGRNFRADEIQEVGRRDKIIPSVIIITSTLAKQLFPDGSALGKVAYVSDKPSVIVGIVERMRSPFVDSSLAQWADNSTLLPLRRLDLTMQYIVRTQPGQLGTVAAHIRQVLYGANRLRVISPKDGVRTFAEVRALAYKGDRGMAVLMAAISVILLGVTGAGIVGLTSFWVGQRRKQIGVRRALGATQQDILGYFLTENLLIGAAGVVLGGLLAIGLNLWLMHQFEIGRLAPGYLLASVIALLLLGQCAVLAPALRASRVPPVEATRSV